MNVRNDDALIKHTQSIAGRLLPTQSQINQVTVKVGDGHRRERSVEDIITDNFKQKLNELLRKALMVESRRRSDSKRDENSAVNTDGTIRSHEEEINEELLDIEREFAHQHELLKKSIRIDDEPQTEQISCAAGGSCRTKTIKPTNPLNRKNKEDDLLKIPFPESLSFKNENLSQTKYDSLLSLVEDVGNEESIEDLLDLEKKYKELLLRMLDIYEKDKEGTTEKKLKRTKIDDDET